MSVVALLEPQALDPQLELAELTEAARGDGAIVTFVGLARPESATGNAVDAVVLDHHPTLTQQSLQDIAVACGERFDYWHGHTHNVCGNWLKGNLPALLEMWPKEREFAYVSEAVCVKGE